VIGPSWRRVALLRRSAAAVLVALALVLAVSPSDGSRGVPVVVAAADLTAGATLRAADITVALWPGDLAPAGAVSEVAAAEGRVLVGAARAGEALTDVRLAGAVAALGDRPDAAAVPVRLADAGVAGLLAPGRRVDVVTAGDTAAEPTVLAPDAEVLTVLPADGGPGSPRGRLVLVAMPRALAARVAAASIADQVAITLR
jgi:Flp pilus assembly protein CpaB